MHAKSPSAYEFIKKVLVLPSARKLRLERNKFGSVAMGLQPDVLSGIKNNVTQGLGCAAGDHQKMAILAFDEMTIKDMMLICTNYRTC